MSRLLTVQLGGINRGRDRLYDVVRSSRHDVLDELNNWFFDYFRNHKLAMEYLPHLDDWHHSQEDSTYWSIAFPDETWHIWIRSELLEFP